MCIGPRKALTPNDFISLDELASRLHQFEGHFESIAKPFEWCFTRRDLAKMLEKLHKDSAVHRKVA